MISQDLNSYTYEIMIIVEGEMIEYYQHAINEWGNVEMNVKIRKITAIPTLMHWRKEVIENVFGVTPSKRLLVANRRYYRQHIVDGSYIAAVAEVGGTDVGCGAICLSEELPSPDNPSGHCAYLMNIYVRKEYRGHGVGHSIIEWLVDKAMQLGYDKIYLISRRAGSQDECHVFSAGTDR